MGVSVPVMPLVYVGISGQLELIGSRCSEELNRVVSTFKGYLGMITIQRGWHNSCIALWQEWDNGKVCWGKIGNWGYRKNIDTVK